LRIIDVSVADSITVVVDVNAAVLVDGALAIAETSTSYRQASGWCDSNGSRLLLLLL
jgi:hypothetical protein